MAVFFASELRVMHTIPRKRPRLLKVSMTRHHRNAYSRHTLSDSYLGELTAPPMDWWRGMMKGFASMFQARIKFELEDCFGWKLARNNYERIFELTLLV